MKETFVMKSFAAIIEEVVILRRLVEVDAADQHEAVDKVVDPATPASIAIGKPSAQRTLVHISEDPRGDLKRQNDWQRRVDGNQDAR